MPKYSELWKKHLKIIYNEKSSTIMSSIFEFLLNMENYYSLNLILEAKVMGNKLKQIHATNWRGNKWWSSSIVFMKTQGVNPFYITCFQHFFLPLWKKVLGNNFSTCICSILLGVCPKLKFSFEITLLSKTIDYSDRANNFELTGKKKVLSLKS